MITIHEESRVHFFRSGAEGHLEIHHSHIANSNVVIVVEDGMGRRLSAELSSDMREALGRVLLRTDKETQ